MCGLRGATVGCRVERCPESYHLECANKAGALFNAGRYVIACKGHKHEYRNEALAAAAQQQLQ